MKLKFPPFNTQTLGGLLANVGLVIGILLLFGIFYFYIYLPGKTNHGDSITVPDLTGMKMEELDQFLTDHDLRYEISDSSYSEKYPPLTVLLQFPKVGSKVKEGRMIYITVNRVTPPTVPLPDLVNSSRLNGEVLLRSNELKIGRIIMAPGPFLNLIQEMRYNGKKVEAQTRVPKGAVIDLLVGDGNGPSGFTIGSLIGDSFDEVLFKLSGWNLHLGRVQIPEGVDTTGVDPVVYKQLPEVGDSISVGDPVDIWIGPKGYKEPEENDETEN